MRELRADAILRQSDGPDFTAEIDWSLFHRRNNNTRRTWPQTWVSYGTCRQTKGCNLVAVPEHFNRILSPVIEECTYSSRNCSYFWRIVSFKSIVNRKVHPPQNESFTQFRTTADKCSHTIHGVYLTQSHIQK
jgi:hypothetical protein